MSIQFACPNGHKITAGDEFAGKVGVCPKCKVKFRVPLSGNEDESDNVNPDDLIIFFCSNGHKLNAPPKLAGSRGQCPHCNVKFVIPEPADSDEQVDLEEDLDDLFAGDPLNALEDVEDMDELVVLDDSTVLPEFGSSVSSMQENLAVPDDVDLATPEPKAVVDNKFSTKGMLPKDRSKPTIELIPEQPAKVVHPVSVMFQQLWSEKSNGSKLEISLKDGESLSPDHFSSKMSGETHGLFAVKGENDKLQLVAVAWDSVQKISVEGLKELPKGFA